MPAAGKTWVSWRCRHQVDVGAAQPARGGHHRGRDGPGEDRAGGRLPGRPALQRPVPARHYCLPRHRPAPVAARAAAVVPALQSGRPARVSADRTCSQEVQEASSCTPCTGWHMHALLPTHASCVPFASKSLIALLIQCHAVCQWCFAGSSSGWWLRARMASC